MKKKPIFRLFDFEVLNKEDVDDYTYDGKKFLIKMFGMDEKGKTYCIFVKNFNPFFYVKTPDSWIKGKEDVDLKFGYEISQEVIIPIKHLMMLLYLVKW